MSIDVGSVKITELINDNKFFKFKQNKVEYYALELILEEKQEGYLVFNLDKKFDRLFQQSDYNNSIMIELIAQVDKLYFVSFADEDPESEIIEYVGEIEKSAAINIYEKNKKD
jgi:hypothetical protein